MEGKGWLLLPSPAPAWAAEAGQLHAEAISVSRELRERES